MTLLESMRDLIDSLNERAADNQKRAEACDVANVANVNYLEGKATAYRMAAEWIATLIESTSHRTTSTPPPAHAGEPGSMWRAS